MGTLRERGVYALPDESEVVAVADSQGAYLLYPLQDWGLYPRVPALYEVYASGQVRSRGKSTGWRIKDLRDTGRTGGVSYS